MYVPLSNSSLKLGRLAIEILEIHTELYCIMTTAKITGTTNTFEKDTCFHDL